MDSLPKIDDIGDDSVDFAELEAKFNNVIHDLVNDKSLEKFRVEYEKLHEALIDSHNQNKILVTKCTELNEDIVKNSKEISSIILMTQNDQKTITTLRSEFEKAWHLVEGASDREQQSKSIIASLKGEIDNLTKLIQSTEKRPENEQYSSQALEEETTALKEELKNNEQIMDELRNQLEETRFHISETRKATSLTEPVIDDLNQQLDSTRAEVQQVVDEAISIQRQMEEQEHLITSNTEEKAAMKGRIKDQKEAIKDKERQLDNVKNSMLIFLEDQKRIFGNLDEFKFQLREAQKGRKETENLYKRFEDRIQSKLENAANLPKMLSDLEKEHADLVNDDSEMTRYRREVIEAKKEHIKALTANRDTLVMLNLCYNTEGLEVRKYKLQNDNAERQISDINNEIAIAKNEQMNESLQQRGVLIAITNQITDIGKNREFASKIEFDMRDQIQLRKTYTDEANNQELIHRKNLQLLDEMDRELSDIKEATKRYIEMKDNVQKERDELSRRLEVENKQRVVLQSDYDTIRNHVAVLKADIRSMDHDAVVEHLEKLSILDELEKMYRECEEIKAKTEIAVKEANLLQKKVNTQKHVLSEGDLDVHVLQRDNDMCLHNMKIIKNQISIKLQERSLQFAQIKVLQNQLTQGTASFDKLKQKIAELQNELNWEIERKNGLEYKCRLLDMLKKEKVRVECELIQTQSKVTALEDELKHPIPVSKWVFLESTNPEVATLLRMKLKILNEMARKMAVTTRLNAKRESMLEEIAETERKLGKCKNTQVGLEYKYLQFELKKKNKELNQLQRIFDENSAYVSQFSEDVVSARDELRVERNAYYDIRQKSINARIQPQIDQRTSFRMSKAPNSTMYFGGGFAYGGSQNVPLVQPPSKQNQTASKVKVKKNKKAGKSNNFLPSVDTERKQRDSLRRNRKTRTEEETSYAVRPPSEPTEPKSARRGRRRNASNIY